MNANEHRMTRLLLLSFVVALSLTSLASAQLACSSPAAPCTNPNGGCPGVTSAGAETARVTQQINNTWNLLAPLAVIAVMISFTIAALIIIVGTAIKDDKVRNFGLGELYEAISTAITIGFIYMFVVLFLQSIPNAILQNGSPTTQFSGSPFYSALTNLCNVLTNNVGPASAPLYNGGLENIYSCLYSGQSYGGSNNNCYFLPGWQSNSNAGGNDYADISWYPLSIGADLTIPSTKFVGSLATGLVSGITNYLKINDALDVQVPEVVASTFLIDGMYLIWGEYYLLIFFAYVSPLFIIIGIIFRAIFPTRALGGFMIAMGIAFYIIAPTLIAFLYGNTTFNIQPQSCANQGGPNYCNSSYNIIVHAVGELWLQIIFYPLLTISLTYVFITQIANFIGAGSQGMNRLRVGFI